MNEEKKISEMTAEELSNYASEALVAKNKELLDELKKTKNAASELQENFNVANAELNDFKLHRPVNELISKLFKPGISADVAKILISQYVDFRLENDGSVGVYDKSGERVNDVREGKQKEPLPLDYDAFHHWLDEVSGGTLIEFMAGQAIGTGAGGHISHRGNIPLPKENKAVPHSARLGLK